MKTAVDWIAFAVAVAFLAWVVLREPSPPDVACFGPEYCLGDEAECRNPIPECREAVQ